LGGCKIHHFITVQRYATAVYAVIIVVAAAIAIVKVVIDDDNDVDNE